MARQRTAREQSQLFGNRLYNGDNLAVLRSGEIAPGSIDLVYLDPPFNSKKDYNVIFKEPSGLRPVAQKQAFRDTWEWNVHAMNAFHDTLDSAPTPVVQAMQAFRSMLGENDILAYLSMMAPRLVELHRALKNTGSLYLHCDPTASHYLKLLLDAVFGAANFRNEVIWRYRRWTGSSRRFLKMHDVLLYYAKDHKVVKFNQLFTPYTDASLARKQSYHTRIKGEDVYVTSINPKGVAENDVWEIQLLNSQSLERKRVGGYPTQKPEALLERVIEASSDEGDVVLDPFCGCGTAVSVAQRLKRQWIGIDITRVATDVIQKRLRDEYGDEIKDVYEFIPKPVTAEDARKLSNEPYLFQWWSLEKVGAQPAPKRKGADKGIDGRLYFRETDQAGRVEARQVVISVKAGQTGPAHVRELVGVVKREDAAMGVLITLRKPTKAMLAEAASGGLYYSPTWETKYPKIQVITVEDLLSDKPIDYPAKLPSAMPITEEDIARLRTRLDSTL